ncbi:hypothetical protein ACWEPC_01010 [Nonomuraea sp. NPDC004297]
MNEDIFGDWIQLRPVDNQATLSDNAIIGSKICTSQWVLTHPWLGNRSDCDKPPPGRCATPARYSVHHRRCRAAVGMSAAPKITALRGGHVSLAAAVDALFATSRTANPNTHRAYASAIDRVIALLGRDRPLTDVADIEIGTALAELWGTSAPTTWNRNRAAVISWLTWCHTKKHWAAPSVPADAERRKESTAAPASAPRMAPSNGCIGTVAPPTCCPSSFDCPTAAPARTARCSCPNAARPPLADQRPRTAMRYVTPGAESIAKVTEALAPRRRTH